jgi:hypothetical protein
MQNHILKRHTSNNAFECATKILNPDRLLILSCTALLENVTKCHHRVYTEIDVTYRIPPREHPRFLHVPQCMEQKIHPFKKLEEQQQ